jgi:putative transposase
MNYNQSGFKCRKGIIELSHKHPLGTKLYFKIPEKYLFQKVYQITVFKDKKEFYLSIVYEKNELEFIDNNLVQAFDLGLIKQTAVNIQGKFIELINKRPDKYWQKPKEQLQSRMSHCRKYSRRWFKLNKQFTHCTTKSANQLKDFQHKLSRKIINNTKANTIIVGDLSVKEMSMNSKSKGLSRSLQNTGSIGRLVGFLAYKAKLAGKRVIKINESNTSKTCCSCGGKKEMPLSERVYMCSCGNTIDRDRNSSINIMSKYLCTNGLWTAYQNFSDNLRQTGLVITNHSQEATSSITEGD